METGRLRMRQEAAGYFQRWRRIVGFLWVAVSILGVRQTEAKPIQLIRPSKDHSRLEAVQSGLLVLRAIEAPIAVISAVGVVHSGKSFLLNRLAEVRSGGFTVGYSVRAETEGLWMLGEPVQYQGTSLVFLDTEGFFSANVSDTYDAKMFAISTLLSSEVIYNTVKFIDNQQVELLELMIRRTNLFGLRAYAKHNSDEHVPFAAATGRGPMATQPPVSNLADFLSVLVPSRLSWVVQDFVQDLEGKQPEDWLAELIEKDRAAERNASVGMFFKSIDCVPLPVPAGDSETLQKLDLVNPLDLDPAYRRDLAIFRRRLFDRAAVGPKLKGLQTQQLMTGSDLADLLEFLVLAANSEPVGEMKPFPELPSIAEQFTNLQLRLIQSDIVTIVEKDLMAAVLSRQPGRPLARNEFDLHVKESYRQAKDLWDSSTKGFVNKQHLKEELRTAEQNFANGLAKVRERVAAKNCEVVAAYCDDIVSQIVQEFQQLAEAKVTQAQLPHLLDSELAELSILTSAKFNQSLAVDKGGWEFEVDGYTGNCCKASPREAFDAQLAAIRQKIMAANDALIAEEFDSIVDALLAQWHTNIRGDPRQAEELSKARQDRVNQAFTELRGQLTGAFTQAAIRYRGLPVFSRRLRLLEQQIDQMETEFWKEWSAKCAREAEQFIKSASTRYPYHLRQRVSLPMHDEALNHLVADQETILLRDFHQVVFCVDVAAGQLFKKRLNSLLTDTREALNAQNVKTLKDISGQPLKDLGAKLTEESQRYYILWHFGQRVEREAMQTLQAAMRDYDEPGTVGGDATSSMHKISESLLQQVAAKFAEDDLGAARTIIWCNGLILLGAVIAAVTVGHFFWLAWRRHMWAPFITWGAVIVLLSVMEAGGVRGGLRRVAIQFGSPFGAAIPTFLAAAAGGVALSTLYLVGKRTVELPGPMMPPGEVMGPGGPLSIRHSSAWRCHGEQQYDPATPYPSVTHPRYNNTYPDSTYSHGGFLGGPATGETSQMPCPSLFQTRQKLTSFPTSAPTTQPTTGSSRIRAKPPPF